MSLKEHYIYDEVNCEFVPIQINRLEMVLYTASLWLLNGVVLAGALISILSTYYATPSELALKAENDVLLEQLELTRLEIESIEVRVEEIAKADNEMYRSILGLNTISIDEREAGTGGSDAYQEFDLYSAESADVLKWTAGKLDNLQRRLDLQTFSFEQIKAYYNNNSDRMIHIPAIKPVDNIIISAYGMRDHPVLGYRRMHEGIDFRSDIGSPVFATGDGVIRFSGTRGTYGRIVIIDHGFGYETRYAHLSGMAPNTRAGRKVKRGDLIGYTGDSGQVKGPHLHYEVHFKGQPVDPLLYIFANTTPEEYRVYQELAATEHSSMD